MSMIRVKTVPGRIAFTAARGGKQIPSDRFIDVEHTAYVERLLNFHQDIEQEVAKKPAAKSLTE